MSQEKEQLDLLGLAQAHWEYVELVLREHGEAESVIKKCGFHYRTAFIHGHKHSEERKPNS